MAVCLDKMLEVQNSSRKVYVCMYATCSFSTVLYLGLHPAYTRNLPATSASPLETSLSMILMGNMKGSMFACFATFFFSLGKLDSSMCIMYVCNLPSLHCAMS